LEEYEGALRATTSEYSKTTRKEDAIYPPKFPMH